MSSLLVVCLCLSILVSCSSIQKFSPENQQLQGYQHGKQLDEKSLRDSFFQR